MVGGWEQWNCISRNPILAMLTLYILVMTLFLASVTLASLAHHFDPHVQAWPVFEFSSTSSSVQEKIDKGAAPKKSPEDTWCCSVPFTWLHLLSVCGVCITYFLAFLSSLYKNARMKNPQIFTIIAWVPSSHSTFFAFVNRRLNAITVVITYFNFVSVKL